MPRPTLCVVPQVMLFSYLSRLLSLTFFFLIEYLSPELIFNLGHNHASDIWALGVIIYEMLMAVTPFAPKRPDNVTELFTNIAMVKKNGLVLSSRIDQHAGNPQARILISQILKADPAE